MKCHAHESVDATATCASCGRALCPDCQHDVGGSARCAAHTSDAPALPPPPPPPPSPSLPARSHKAPGLAFFLGLFPGLGHLYLGLPRRAAGFLGAFLAAAFFADEVASIFGFAAAFVVAYSAFDASRLAPSIPVHATGPEVDELKPLRLSPIFGVVLVVIGLLKWIDRYWEIDLSWLRNHWPLAVVAIGIWIVISAMREKASTENENA